METSVNVMAAHLCTRYQKKQKLCILLCIGFIIVGIIRASTRNYEDRTDIHSDKWLDNPTIGCENQFVGYANEFAVLHNAKFDKHNKTFRIPCKSDLPSYTFFHGKEGTPLQEWFRKLKTIKLSATAAAADGGEISETLTIVIMRIEAHNIYHTLCEWYNIFLLSKLLHFEPKSVNILLLDDRPKGLMDETWDVLFGHVIRYSDVKPHSVFKTLIWNVIGYESPMNFHMLPLLPYADEFYRFFITSFGVRPVKRMNCRNLTAVIIWRRDYLSHPECALDFQGLIHRKFKNENQIFKAVQTALPSYNVRDIVLEKLSMKQQVQLFSRTDVLIGMHGAGMAHTLLLPPHAAVFEIFPKYWGFLKHFKAFSRWRGLKYIGWQNRDVSNEHPGFYTYIPIDVVEENVNALGQYQTQSLSCSTVDTQQ